MATTTQQREAVVLSYSDNPPSVSQVCVMCDFGFCKSLCLCAVWQVIIPECGDIYCPWEVFKEIALSRICMECVEEPLRTTSESLLADVTGSSGEKDDDDDSGWSALEIMSLVGIIVSAVALVVAAVLFYYSRHPNSSRDLEKKLYVVCVKLMSVIDCCVLFWFLVVSRMADERDLSV